jgi:hypothetical protein
LDGNRSVDPERLKTGKNYRLLQANEGYIWPLCIYIANETCVFFNRQPSKTFNFRDVCHGGIIPKQRVTVLLAGKADGTDKLPPLVTRKYRSQCCFRNVKTTGY